MSQLRCHCPVCGKYYKRPKDFAKWKYGRNGSFFKRRLKYCDICCRAIEDSMLARGLPKVIMALANLITPALKLEKEDE